ncbi:SDR family oxidoreductase (plasmid) [Pseudoalteromonas sp. T1lg65]|uniref:SDR family oxidoreductase n=1 Tax=Pseudoalteromonas sp. T1lg65 TaxID=2077101 RepID=UPI003F78DBF3
MKTILITGANRGIGLALTKTYLQGGWHVIATCREPQYATELNELMPTFPELQVFALNMINYEQMEELSEKLAPVKLDIVLNNAGVYGPKEYGFGEVDIDEWREVLEVNVIAPMRLAELFYTHLMQGEDKIFAVLSSKLASNTLNTEGGGYIYRCTKAALNSIVKSLSNDLLPEGIRTAALHPGWVKTDMGGPDAPLSTEESATGLKSVLDHFSDAQSGGFYDYQGEAIPW